MNITACAALTCADDLESEDFRHVWAIRPFEPSDAPQHRQKRGKRYTRSEEIDRDVMARFADRMQECDKLLHICNIVNRGGDANFQFETAETAKLYALPDTRRYGYAIAPLWMS